MTIPRLVDASRSIFMLFLMPATAVVSSLDSLPVRADEFVLANGGTVVGTLLNPEQRPRNEYVVEGPDGVVVRLSNEQVEEVVSKSPEQLQYESLLTRMPDTVDGHWKMSEWCRRQNLEEAAERHLTEIIRREPDNEQARKALGFRKIDDRWIKPDQFMTEQGYVRHQGAWRLRQEVELETRDRQRETNVKEWRRSLRIWRGWIVKGRGRQDEAVVRIKELRDPHAAVALSAMLPQEEFKTLRLLYIEVLGRLQAPSAVAPFIKLALEDEDATVRDRCLNELARFARPQAVRALVKALRHQDNVVVNRAATGLEVLGDPSATPELIEALTTKHKVRIGGGGGISTSFGSPGAGGLSVGGGPKVMERELKNPSVLGALAALNPGVNFTYDRRAWENWYATRHAEGEISFRRAE